MRWAFPPENTLNVQGLDAGGRGPAQDPGALIGEKPTKTDLDVAISAIRDDTRRPRPKTAMVDNLPIRIMIQKEHSTKIKAGAVVPLHHLPYQPIPLPRWLDPAHRAIQ